MLTGDPWTNIQNAYTHGIKVVSQRGSLYYVFKQNESILTLFR